MEEKMEERHDGSTLSHSPTASTETPEALDKEFMPIRDGANVDTARSLSRSRTNASSHRSMSRIRSTNGYGVGEPESAEEEEEGRGDIEAGNEAEKDPFEVHWENGEEDPMNPRSMSMFRKWIVVLIVSTSSFCVYVYENFPFPLS